MDFIVQQKTLEQMSLAKITTLLWNQPDIRMLVTEFTNSCLHSKLEDDVICFPALILKKEKWQEIEDQVIDKRANLTIPKTLKEKMLGYVEAVGVQILKWMEYHRKYCHLDLDLPKEICWTPQATIDKKKTAEVLVRDASINIITRYELACIYCLEEYIPGLFNEIPESGKELYYSREDPGKILQIELVMFWGYYINGEIATIDYMIRRKYNHRCLYACLLMSATNSGNKAAAEYFLEKLNPFEEHSIILSTALYVAKTPRNFYPKLSDPPKEYYTEVLGSLLSKLNQEGQIQVLQINPLQVLWCFLDWPWQSFFSEMASRLCNFIPQNYYNNVFMIINHKIILGCKDYNYKKIFQDVWQQIPDANKRYIVSDVSTSGLVYMLLQFGDADVLELIFQDATLIDKYTLLLSNRGRNLCKYLIDHDKWDLFKLFVQLLISSKDEMIKFKKEFEKYVKAEGNIRVDKHEKLFSLLDGFVCEYDKTINVKEANDTSSAKRSCNTEFENLTYSEKKVRRNGSKAKRS